MAIMTRKKLEKLYYLKKELRMWEKRKAELQADIALSLPSPDGMPHSRTNNIDNPTQRKAIKLAEADKHIQAQILRIKKATREIEQFIMTIDDPETRMIVEYRCVYNMHWDIIGDKAGYSERQCKRKYKALLDTLKHT
ncbi:MAG: hypothetical protein K5886_02730 [Lachnospiraceae bacterium]|nr:hypothetical protein [Lachnospiraceae bacterium]